MLAVTYTNIVRILWHKISNEYQHKIGLVTAFMTYKTILISKVPKLTSIRYPNETLTQYWISDKFAEHLCVKKKVRHNANLISMEWKLVIAVVN